MAGVTRAQVAEHLAAFLEAARGWQRRSRGTRHAGGLPCPVARIPLQWTEFFTLAVAVDAARRGASGDEDLALGLLDYLERAQRPNGAFDAGFCGDLHQPCNAAFALRPLATALRDWPPSWSAGPRDRLRAVLERAAGACVEGGMNTPNHRWVAAGGLAHAGHALGDASLSRSAEDWTRCAIDIDCDGAWSEGSPNYALVSNDSFLDLEALCDRRELGDLARRSLRYLRTVAMPDGGFAAVASRRYDTEGSSDAYARAAWVGTRLGAPDLAGRALEKLWRTRSAPGLLAPHGFAPLGAHPKAKLYPSVTSAIAADCLMRLLRCPEAEADWPEPADAAAEDGLARLQRSGLVRYRAGAFGAAVACGPNLFEAQHDGAVIEGARLLVHAAGWNPLLVTGREIVSDGLELELASAPGSPWVRLPQLHRDEPETRRPGTPYPSARARLTARCGPGARLWIELELTAAEGVPEEAVRDVHAMLELAARPDQRIFGRDGQPLEAPVALPAAGGVVLAGAGAGRLTLDFVGGSGHALQVDHYGYGSGDALWSPSFHPRCLRLGAELPTRLELELRGD